MSDNTPHMLDCPHPDCHGVLRVPADTPAGVYPCICHEINVRLSWAHYVDRGRVPYLAVEPKPEPTDE